MEILNDPDYLNNPVKPTSPPTTAVPHITVAPTPTVRNRLRNTIIVLATLMIASALSTAYVFIMYYGKNSYSFFGADFAYALYGWAALYAAIINIILIPIYVLKNKPKGPTLTGNIILLILSLIVIIVSMPLAGAMLMMPFMLMLLGLG